ncbi:MAG: DNRLRE domain-containing protein [Acidimicrobiales bacterium]
MPAAGKAPTPPFPVGPIPALPKAGEEVLDRRTERSKTFATDTVGQFRTELYSERVHYKDAKGVYQKIEADLGASKNGVRQSKANAFVLELADDANAAAMARLRLDDATSVGFALDGAGAVKARADASASTYAGAKAGVDVRLTSRPDGLKEELVLASAAAGDRFVFPLELKGLTAAIDANGDVVFRDRSGAERARTPHGYMTDSALDPRSDEVPTSYGVTYALIPHAKGSALEVRLDRAWLTDPARVWPVVVDPQLTVNTDGDDTFVMSGFHADNSHSLELKVGTYDGGSHVGRSFVRFGTTAINAKVVNSAQFHIGESHSWNCASAWPTVHRATAGWAGGSMQDWPGASFDANPAGGVISANGSCGSRTVVYDVTSAATYWAANPTQSFGLVLNTSATDNNAWKKFKSSETGAPPRLEVTWSEPAPPSTGNAFGYLDLVYPFVGGVVVQGWAIDPDTSAPIAVLVYADGVYVEALVAGTSRPDLGPFGYGNNHGFYDFAPVAAGSHNVCVYAVNVGAGSNPYPLMGCKAVVVPSRVSEPFGYLDNVNLIPGGAQVRGWTIDFDTVAPITVQVWSDAGYVTTLNADVSRPDVAGQYPAYGPNHGYDSFVGLTPGYHNVCAWGINVAAGATNSLLGCRQVTVAPPNPPSAPTNVAAVANLDGSVRVTWGLSASSGGPPMYVYGIYAYNNPAATDTGLYRVECATCTSTSFTGLTPGASYYFKVHAFNTAGLASPPATTAPVSALANGAGAMGYFSFDSYPLTDTLSAQVNVGTGNLMISGNDASVATVGGAKGIGRTYNTASLAPGASAPPSPVLGPGWRFSESPDHRLVPNSDQSVTYITPSGANPTFIGTPLVAPKGFDATLVREGDSTFTMTFPTSAYVLRFRSDGLLSSETDRNGNVLNVNYPATGYPTTITGNAGVTSARTLNVVYGAPAGKISSLSRTADGVTASVGYSYDSAGRLEKVTDAEGGLTTFVYDAANRITKITDAANHVTDFTYDAAGRVATVTREVPGANAVTTYDYTSTPGHTKVTDPNNNPPTDYTFFADGRMKEALDARGTKTVVEWTPDLMVGKVSSGVDPNPLTTLLTNVFNGLNLTSVLSPTGASSVTGGYGSGVTARLPGFTKDTLGNQTDFGYDPKGNLSSVTAPVVGMASVLRNADGTVKESAAPGQAANPTKYGYTNGQQTSVIPPTGSSLASTAATYDGFGRLKTSTSAMGVTTTYAYDKLDRVRTETHSDTTPTITYEYFAGGNPKSRADSTGTTSYTYDEANRPKTKSSPAGNLSYTWDRAGNLATATDPAGTTTYRYDKVNRLDQVDEPSGRKDVFAYDTMGRRTDSWYNTGANIAYLLDAVIPPSSFATHTKATYDADSQLLGLKTTRASSDADANRVSDLCYYYRSPVPAGSVCGNPQTGTATNIRHAVTDVLTGQTTTYAYDPAGRLANAATSGGPSYTYGYDERTNRTSGPEGAHSVNSGDQLTDTGFAYNANGGLTAGGSLSNLAYTGIGQTKSITQGGNSTAYTYAGGGQGERTTAGPTTALHSLLGLVVETTAGATTSYIREASGALLYEHTPGGDFYYVRDGQGSVIALVDPNGVQRAVYTYDPYGDHATATGLNGAVPPNPWRWSGSYLDATGLYKMGARYYDSALGRFTQVDPVAGGSANNYDYCSGDPVNCSDRNGLRGTKALPPELAGPCLSGDETQLRDPVCERYRKALVTNDSDFYYKGKTFSVPSRPNSFLQSAGNALSPTLVHGKYLPSLDGAYGCVRNIPAFAAGGGFAGAAAGSFFPVVGTGLGGTAGAIGGGALGCGVGYVTPIV